jgi:hypothetical protein
MRPAKAASTLWIMRAVFYGYFVMCVVAVLAGGFFWTAIALRGGGPAFASIAPALTLIAGSLFTVEGLAMSFDWGGASRRFQAIRDAGDASPLMRFLTWMPTRPKMPFARAYRIVGGIAAFWGICLLGVFVVMLGYGAWR